MAIANRNADAGLSAAADDRRVARQARALARAEFFQTVRAIIAAAATEGGGLGDDTRPAAEPVTFRVSDGLRHPDVEIASLDRPEPGGPVSITVGHMGLTGPLGVMPDHYSDLLVTRRRARDPSMARFLDLFNHRSISLFYRAWAKYRLPVRFEEEGGRFADPFSRALAALAGITRLNDPAMLAAAGPLGRGVRSAGALSRIVAALLDLPIAVEELRPRRIRIAPAERSRLGSAFQPQGHYAALGRDVVLGETTWDVGGGFRLRVGPLALADFVALAEGQDARRRLVEAVRMAVGGGLAFDIQLVLRADAVPAARLGATAPPRLSRTGWLLAAPASRDRDDAVLPGAAA
jgi:type VI secretion system protein ImpH